MTNSIFVDIDTEREKAIIFGKPPETPRPSNQKEAKEMIMNDIATLAEALIVLILTAHHNGYADKYVLVDTCDATFKAALAADAAETKSDEAA